jgi:hypothetical protein
VRGVREAVTAVDASDPVVVKQFGGAGESPALSATAGR